MAKEKKKYGQYFTIPEIAEFMVSMTDKASDCKILEPSCGEGVFLKQLEEKGYTNITAYEIDESLDLGHFDYIRYSSFVSSPVDEKYDLIIGNPPYIRWKNLEPELKKELETNSLWKRYFNSLCDYLFIFILKSIEQLNSGGELIFICPEYWMNTTHSFTLRKYMCENGYIQELYSFKEAPIFDGVSSSLIIFKYIKEKVDSHNIDHYTYTRKNRPSINELIEKTCFEHQSIPGFEQSKRWLLADAETQKSIMLLEKACKRAQTTLLDDDIRYYTIGDFCDIGNGMVSGLDKAFKLDSLEGLNSTERENVIKVYKAKDLAPYANKSISYYFFTQEVMAKDEFPKLFPLVNEKLLPYKEELAKRYSYNREIPYWEFVFPRNFKLFSQNQSCIFVPCKERISNKSHFRFCYADSDVFPLQDVTAIYKKSRCKESIEYILAFLNNDRVFRWLNLNGIIKGAIVEFSEAPISSIPYRRINWENDKEVEIHNFISKYVSLYLNNQKEEYLVHINNKFNELFDEANF